MNKLNDIAELDSKEEQKGDDRSMMEVMRAKRQATEKQLEEKKGEQPGAETIEERKARLKAQRDLLREMKNKERAQELADFNEKTKTKDNLYEELRKMDSQKQSAAQLSELEHRRKILGGVKQQISRDEAEERERAYQKKVTQMESKIVTKEEQARRDEADRLLAEREKLDAAKVQADQKKGFLDNLQAFKVE